MISKLVESPSPRQGTGSRSLPWQFIGVWSVLLMGLFWTGLGHAAQKQGPRPNVHRESFNIDGVTREAIIYIPPSSAKNPAPVVFVFHGHGGTMEKTLGQFSLPKNWPEAISVHMQGLNTVSPGDPEGKKPGWQGKAGDYQDRDLKFFDVVLASLVKSGKADEKHIYVTGFSNGGGFTYVLWAARGDKIAAVAPCAAPNAHKIVSQLKPKPVLNVTGRKDPLVKLANQQSAVTELRKLNGCEGEGRAWGRQGTLYRSRTGNPLIFLTHPGGHEVPENVPVAVVKFFQGDMRNEEPEE